MIRHVRPMVLALLAAGLIAAPALAQEPDAESLDQLQEDIDFLEQLEEYQFTVEQLQQLLPILQELAGKSEALESYKQSEEALAPLRALREALIKGGRTDELQEGVQGVWERLEELEMAHEEAVAPAMKKIAAVLTDEQLQMLATGEDWAYEQADEIFATLDSARGFNDETYNAWRDRTARQVAFRAAGESAEKGAQVEGEVKQFLDKVRKLKDEPFYDQSDDLFDELTVLLSEAQPAPIREVAEAQAAEELEYVLRSERAVPLIEAQIKARGGG